MRSMPILAGQVMSFRSGHRKSYIAVFDLENIFISLKLTSFFEIIYITLSCYRGPTLPSLFFKVVPGT